MMFFAVCMEINEIRLEGPTMKAPQKNIHVSTIHPIHPSLNGDGHGDEKQTQDPMTNKTYQEEISIRKRERTPFRSCTCTLPPACIIIIMRSHAHTVSPTTYSGGR